MFVIEVRGKWRKKLKVILGYMQNSREVGLGYVSHCLKKKKKNSMKMEIHSSKYLCRNAVKGC